MNSILTSTSVWIRNCLLILRIWVVWKVKVGRFLTQPAKAKELLYSSAAIGNSVVSITLGGNQAILGLGKVHTNNIVSTFGTLVAMSVGVW